MQTLYISTTSPYTRMLLMIAYTKNIELALRFVVPWENPSELVAVNSLSQVPALAWQNGDVITETPLIIQALAPMCTRIILPTTCHALPRRWALPHRACEPIPPSDLAQARPTLLWHAPPIF